MVARSVSVFFSLAALAAAQQPAPVAPLVFLAAGALDWSIACDPNLLGLQVAVQGLLLQASGGCAPPTTPIALRVSDTKVLTVQ